MESMSTEALLQQVRDIFKELERRSSIPVSTTPPPWISVVQSNAHVSLAPQHIAAEDNGELVLRHACGNYACPCRCILRPSDDPHTPPSFDLLRLYISRIPIEEKFNARMTIIAVLKKHKVSYHKLYLPDSIRDDATHTFAVIIFTRHVQAVAAQVHLTKEFTSWPVNFFRQRDTIE